ncbi:MAG: septum formation protein Maf [Elusimicrobia bacterium RIFOXYB2_FULL_49_7]|nr:MAG: septum formation protein Maf [Elusimicrobia bacterium RIFOXYB2_FULL_49_7]
MTGLYRLSRPLFLASASPRRNELLKRFGIPFSRLQQCIDEKAFALPEPEQHVKTLAAAKAKAAATQTVDGIILGFDTVVFFNGHILEKPTDEEDARRMLSLLSGQTHTVFTGIAAYLAPEGILYTTLGITEVRFRELDEREIINYIKTREPFDKAGAYGIQDVGGLLVKEIKGCYFNVVGLPVTPLIEILRPFFI